MTKMYGLFKYIYDYHEWEYLVATSTDKDKLVKFVGNDPTRYLELTLTKEQHQELSEDESTHYYIYEILHLD